MKKALLLALVPCLSGCGFALVNGPPKDWESVDADGLQAMAEINQTLPCTKGETFVVRHGLEADKLLGTISLIYGAIIVREEMVDSPGGQSAYPYGFQNLALGAAFLLSARSGNRKAEGCKAFNARLLQERRLDAQSLNSHEWADKLSPPHALGVTLFDPVFGLPIKRGH